MQCTQLAPLPCAVSRLAPVAPCLVSKMSDPTASSLYFHVWITLRSHQWPGVNKLDMRRDEVLQRVVEPYRARQTILISGRTLSFEEIERVQIHATDKPSDLIKAELRARKLPPSKVPIDYRVFATGIDVTDDLLNPLPSAPTQAAAHAAIAPITQRVLALCWEFLGQKHRWPTVRELDSSVYHEFAKSLADACAGIPERLCFPDLAQVNAATLPDTQEIRLSVEGLALVPGAEPVVAAIASGISKLAKMAAEYQPASPTDYLTVTDTEFARMMGCSESDPVVLAFYSVATYGLPGVARSSSSGSGHWSIALNERELRRYVRVVDVASLLDVSRALQQEQQREAAQLQGALDTLEPPSLPGDGATDTESGDSRVLKESGPDSRRVFIVHGRNLEASRAMDSFVRALGLEPIDFERDAVAGTGSAAPYTGEILQSGLQRAQAVVVLFTPDERVALRDELAASPDETATEMQPRPNVIFEAGMAFISHPKRTILVEVGKVRGFSDIAGIHTVRLDDSIERRQALVGRLRIAGCLIPDNPTGWESAGEFLSSVRFSSRESPE